MSIEKDFYKEVGLSEKEMNDESEIGIIDETKTFKDLVQEFECELILDALECCEGEKKAAANMLGMNRTTLSEKCRRYGIS